MSNIYIRNQNGEKLYIFGNTFNSLQYQYVNNGFKRGKQEIHHIICISDGCLEEIAEYESKERCIEVLDELEKICAQYLYAPGSSGLLRGTAAMPPIAVEVPRVYRMPEK